MTGNHKDYLSYETIYAKIFIQTRKIKFSSIQFCIGNLALFDFIWFQLSYLYGLYLLVLSTCYQSTVITIAI